MTQKLKTDGDLANTLYWAYNVATKMAEHSTKERPEDVHPLLWEMEYQGMAKQCMELSEAATEYIKSNSEVHKSNCDTPHCEGCE